MFERDLRRWAKDMRLVHLQLIGYYLICTLYQYNRKWKFDSSGMYAYFSLFAIATLLIAARTRLSDSSLIHARSEREVFELCGLEWVDPTLRNADV